MASFFTLLITATTIVTASSLIPIMATNQYKVGDAEGWRLPDRNNPNMYEDWASKITFHVGDSIVFVYKNDSVIGVDKRGYYHCNESTSRGTLFKDGNTVVTLEKPGYYYFVSGYLEHCKEGQRLMVEVVAEQSPATSAISGPSPGPLPSAAASRGDASLHALVCISAVLMMPWCFTY
ncbi:early nodulin-like protein 7 [Typha angustifolia]|uniref:early nodulin-like protein 7 n=1 Tax=Typha angustifolia TaxID=59011 RepID=UPI003C2DC855